MRHRIVQLFFPLAPLPSRRSDRARHASSYWEALVRPDARPSKSAYDRPRPLDVAAGRARRWGRRGLVPPPAEDWQPQLCPEPQGVYIPPGFWELPGTIVQPRVAAALPELRGDVR